MKIFLCFGFLLLTSGSWLVAGVNIDDDAQQARVLSAAATQNPVRKLIFVDRASRYAGATATFNLASACRETKVACLESLACLLGGSFDSVGYYEGIPFASVALNDIDLLASIKGKPVWQVVTGMLSVGTKDRNSFARIVRATPGGPAMFEFSIIPTQKMIDSPRQRGVIDLLAQLPLNSAIKKCIVAAVAYGTHGFDKYSADERSEELRKRAMLWPKTQYIVLNGVTEGKHGVKQESDELKRIADELGWYDAQRLLAEGLAEGKYGFDKYSPDERSEELRKRAMQDTNSIYAELYVKTFTTIEEWVHFIYKAERNNQQNH